MIYIGRVPALLKYCAGPPITLFLSAVALASCSKADCRRGDGGDGDGGQFCRACIEALKQWKIRGVNV